MQAKSNGKNMKKGTGISMEALVIAIIALFVLSAILFLITGKGGELIRALIEQKENACESTGGKCYNENHPELMGCIQSLCEKGRWCCSG